MANQGEQPSSSQLLDELNDLSHSFYQAHPARRTTSFALLRSSGPAIAKDDEKRSGSMSRSHRLSISPWLSRPKSLNGLDEDEDEEDAAGGPLTKQKSLPGIISVECSEKKGIWRWKPMRALSHIVMQRVGCLLSVDVVSVHRLPASMNGLRLSVSVRKKETKEGAVQTMPSRVLQGVAEFEETLFIKCHVYCSGGGGTGKPIKIESRLFVISAVAIDAAELDFGKRTIDLGLMVKESLEKNMEGSRAKQWDTTFPLSGKAKGGEIVLKLGFQIMEDSGVGIYNQGENAKLTSRDKRDASFSYARRHSKSSFSVTSPRLTRAEYTSTRKDASQIDLREIDEFSLDEPAQLSKSTEFNPSEPELKDDTDLPDFDIVEKGIEIQEGEKKEDQVVIEDEKEALISNEVVKEVVHDSAHLVRLNELDSIAQQIKALESLMIKDEVNKNKALQEDETPRLDADEDAVTREFLQMLELEDKKEANLGMIDIDNMTQTYTADNEDGDKSIYISDLGKGLRSVVQTRDGGYLCAMNPFDVVVKRKDVPKLAMQISKPFVLLEQKSSSGFEVFQKLAALGSEKLCNKLQSLSSMDELMCKTAEQIAFEGMASAIITGREKGASSSAAKIVATLKTMGTALSEGRKERISTGIWNVMEEPVVMDEILAFSLQKIESMAIEALKIQAGIAEEEAPFDVSALINIADLKHPLDSAVPPEDWEKVCSGHESVIILVVIQLRDILRRYETVGAPSVALIQAARIDQGGKKDEGKFKVTSLNVGGLKLQSGLQRSIWDGKKQRLTAMQWLVAYGLGKSSKKKSVQVKGECDLLWSMSSRVMADMWLKAIRNPDVKIPPK